MAEDPNLLLRIRIAGDHIDGYYRREMDWTDRSINTLTDIVYKEKRIRNAIFQRIIEDNNLREELHTRIHNG